MPERWRQQFASTPGVRRRMQAIKGRDTQPELEIRRRLHRRGLRYRVGVRPIGTLNRRADIVFPRLRIAVFVDGCFWHGCPDHGRRASTVNDWYWPAKIARNVERDSDTTSRLETQGWLVVRLWEHEDPDAGTERVVETVRRRREALGLD